ncbi:prefoldin subunit 4-like [Lingula anatina]|uniref:Prefoldin subunit 4 n=1 Tax=Lingula anatina TaxID=7574 RepID=A0A1S3K786_LINAN|nr:prefoldin subunit 4 [Lingula anatina]XP_013418529.1 prefoldin subunit 4-like [Lingula anatina]|eukprot:XP_013418495.1 prefoldin subunit 4 [Lingula anatina]
MAKVAKSGEDVNVTYEDQQKINKFARHNARMQDLKEELEAKKKELQNLQDAADELLMLEDEESIPYQIGEVFFSVSADETNEMLERRKEELEEQTKSIEQQVNEHKQVLSDLKVHLYAKFGNNINLEAEEQAEP